MSSLKSLTNIFIVIGISIVLFLSLLPEKSSYKVSNTLGSTIDIISELEAEELTNLSEIIKEYLETKEPMANLMATQIQSGRVFAAFDIIDGRRKADEILVYLWVLQQSIIQDKNGLAIVATNLAPIIVRIQGVFPNYMVVSSLRPWEDVLTNLRLKNNFLLDFHKVSIVNISDRKVEDLKDQALQNAEKYYTSNKFKLFKYETDSLLPDILTTAIVSPNGNRAAYLYPNKMGQINNIYMEEISENDIRKWTKLTIDQSTRYSMWNRKGNITDKYTPKKMIWENENELLIIVGHANRVSAGGDLIKFNIDSKEAEVVYPAHEYGKQVTDIKVIRGRLRLFVTDLETNKPISPSEVNPHMPNPHEGFQEIPNLFKNVVQPILT